jgi:uncharacterized alkaline shock family protein YloU
MSRQPIDNRDLRIFDFNINESLNNIADNISNNINSSAKDTTNLLEEINVHLSDISISLKRIADLYTCDEG